MLSLSDLKGVQKDQGHEVVTEGGPPGPRHFLPTLMAALGVLLLQWSLLFYTTQVPPPSSL